MCELLIDALGPRPDRPVDGFFIAAHLAKVITDGTLPVGTKLSQQVIADYYGISRTPVREALRCIQARGLIGGKPHKTPRVVASAGNEDSGLARAQFELSNALRLLEKCLTRINHADDELGTVVAEFIATCKDGHNVER